MLIRHLSYFVALATEGHYARAAKVCSVTQPTITMAVRKLEEDLQVALVIRSHRYVGLTAEGERVLRWGRRILADYASLRAGLSRSRRGLSGRLRLGAIPTALPATPLITSRFCAAHPQVEVDILSMTARQIRESLSSYTIDAGLTYVDPAPLEDEPAGDVRQMALYREHYSFVTSRGHRYAERKNITWAEVAGERLCLLSPQMQSRRIIDALAAAADVQIQAGVASNSFITVLAHVAEGSWSCIVPRSIALMAGRSTDLVVIDFAEPGETPSVGLIVLRRGPLAPVADELTKLVKDIDFQGTFGAEPHVHK